MKARLMLPHSSVEGNYLERCCIFAARRTRTVKDFDDLWEEVNGYSYEKGKNFLGQVIFQDWAADVLEMVHLMYDWEGVPVWLIIELLRHRLVAREFSLEQLSQRAIASSRLKVDIYSHPRLQEAVDRYLEEVESIGSEDHIPVEDLREAFPQGVLVNLCIAGNLRSFHHFFFMRSSPLLQGKGGAHYKFMDLADQMQTETKLVLPRLMETILRA